MDEPIEDNTDRADSDDSDEPEFNCAPAKKVNIPFKNLGQNSGATKGSDTLKAYAIRYNSRRQAAHGVQGISTGYVDQDKSGTYDPQRERVTPPSTPIPRRRNKSPRLDENGNPLSKLPRNHVGYAFQITFPLKSKEGLDYLRSITPGPYSDSSDTAEDSLSDNARPRKRKRITRVIETERPDGLTLEKLTSGHPQRRGCKSCFEIGQDCSLLEDDHDYPCAACDEEGTDCELIVKPEYKGVCQRCKRKRIKCSFREDGGKGLDSCKQCERAGENCVAGPLDEVLEQRMKDRKVEAPIHNRKQKVHVSQPELPPAKDRGLSDRRYVCCNQCREGGLRCSLKNKDRIGPCSNCRKAGEDCKFVSKVSFDLSKITLGNLGDSDESLIGGQKSQDDDGSRFSESPHKQTELIYTDFMRRKRSSKGKTSLASEKASRLRSKTLQNNNVVRHPIPKLIGQTLGVKHIIIRTSFCHPIKFHYQPDPENLHPCSWCDSPVFGLWGHSPKEVEVIPFGGNIGNEEISGGHYEDGKEQTKMCLKCTVWRIRTIACKNHSIRSLAVADPNTLDLTAVGNSMIALANGDLAGGELIQRVEWCSICVAPAEYQCCSVNCGLKLCRICFDLLRRLSKSWNSDNGKLRILDQLVSLWKEDLWKRGGSGELRADTEFLLSSGELWTRMVQGMGMSRYGEDPLREMRKQMSGKGIQQQTSTACKNNNTNRTNSFPLVGTTHRSSGTYSSQPLKEGLRDSLKSGSTFLPMSQPKTSQNAGTETEPVNTLKNGYQTFDNGVLKSKVDTETDIQVRSGVEQNVPAPTTPILHKKHQVIDLSSPVSPFSKSTDVSKLPRQNQNPPPQITDKCSPHTLAFSATPQPSETNEFKSQPSSSPPPIEPERTRTTTRFIQKSIFGSHKPIEKDKTTTTDPRDTMRTKRWETFIKKESIFRTSRITTPTGIKKTCYERDDEKRDILSRIPASANEIIKGRKILSPRSFSHNGAVLPTSCSSSSIASSSSSSSTLRNEFTFSTQTLGKHTSSSTMDMTDSQGNGVKSPITTTATSPLSLEKIVKQNLEMEGQGKGQGEGHGGSETWKWNGKVPNGATIIELSDNEESD